MPSPLLAAMAVRAALISLHGNPKFVFTVEGDPRGFLVSRGFNKASRKSWMWAKSVRDSFLMALSKENLAAVAYHTKGNKTTMSFPFLETSREGKRYFVQTLAFFKNGTHPDPENVHKLLKDALFYKVKNGDKYTGGVYADPMYDKQNPRVEVVVWETEGEPK